MTTTLIEAQAGEVSNNEENKMVEQKLIKDLKKELDACQKCMDDYLKTATSGTAIWDKRTTGTSLSPGKDDITLRPKLITFEHF